MAFWLVSASMTVHTVSLDGDIFIVKDEEAAGRGKKGDTDMTEEETTGSSSTSSLHTLEDESPPSPTKMESTCLVPSPSPPALATLPQVLELPRSASTVRTSQDDPDTAAALEMLEQAAATSSGMVTSMDGFRLAKQMQQKQQGPKRPLQHTDSFALAQQQQKHQGSPVASATSLQSWTTTVTSPSVAEHLHKTAARATAPPPPPPPLPLSSPTKAPRAATATVTTTATNTIATATATTPRRQSLSKVASLPSLSAAASSSCHTSACGTATPCAVAAAAKRHVRFAPSVRVRVVPRYDEDPVQKAATWFSPQDFCDMQREINLCIEEERKRRKEEAIRQRRLRRRRSTGGSGVFSFCQPYSSVGEDDDDHNPQGACRCHDATPPSRSCRGLERISFDAEGERRKALLHNVLCMVLREQWQQKRRGIRNEMILAEISRHHSQYAVEEALVTAQQDAWEVQEDDDENFVMARQEEEEEDDKEEQQEQHESTTTTRGKMELSRQDTASTTTTLTTATTTAEEDLDTFHNAESETEAMIVVWPSVWDRLLWRCGTQPLPSRHTSLPGPRKSTSLPSLVAL